MLSLILVASAFAQQNCDDTNFGACLDQAQQYLESTCNSFKSNATTYAQCLCYQKVADGNCYAQCPQNATIQGEFASVNSAIISLCSAANLNPKTLTYPAPWAPNVPVPGSAPSTTGSSGGITTTPAASTKNGGLPIGFDSLIALGYGIVQFVL